MPRLLLLPVAVGLLCWSQPASSFGLRATVGLEYDDNPFEAVGTGRAGWLNRLYVSASETLLERSNTVLLVRHQWGMKRYWRAEDATGDNGDVMANQLYLDGSHQVHPRAILFFGTQLKSKSVQRVSSEEAYLRAGIRAGLNATIAPGISTSAHYRLWGDDARDATLSDVSLHEVGWETRYGPTRKLRANVGINRRWLDYSRRAIARDESGVLLATPVDQQDRTTELKVGLQLYRAGLLRARYAFVDNHSNSAGYGYNSHRLNFLVARSLGRGFDGQIFFTTQMRRYDEAREEPIPNFFTADDEYEQSVISVRLLGRLTARYGLSLQYKRSRNGSRSDDDSYRKNVYAVGLDINI